MTSAAQSISPPSAQAATFRGAVKSDAGLILEFIRELAEYEKLLHEVKANEAQISETLFGKDPKAFAVIAEIGSEPAGFALCFYNYSTFQGKPGIYIEDLYVRDAWRGRGIGKGFFNHLAARAAAEGCGRIQWWVLDWNQSAIAFYKSLGAAAMDEWTVMRIEGDAMDRLAERAA